MNYSKYLVFILLLASFLAHTAVYPIIPSPSVANAATANVWAGYSLLKHIASCESWGDPNKEPREFDETGRVLHGKPNPNDIGLAQINLPTWASTAANLGFDLYTYQGNLDMAKWIFDHDGSAPWKYSKTCWGQFQAA